jgi:hypothetical protein
MGDRVRRVVLAGSQRHHDMCSSDTPPSCLSRSADTTPASTTYQSQSNAMIKRLGLARYGLRSSVSSSQMSKARACRSNK